MATTLKKCAQDFTRAFVVTNSLGMATVIVVSMGAMAAASWIRNKRK